MRTAAAAGGGGDASWQKAKVVLGRCLPGARVTSVSTVREVSPSAQYKKYDRLKAAGNRGPALLRCCSSPWLAVLLLLTGSRMQTQP